MNASLTSAPLGDADSHIMPTRDWLAQYLTRAQSSLARRAIPDWEAGLEAYAPAAERQRLALGDRRAQLAQALRGPKSLFAPGALEPSTRSEVLDALGIDIQIVFSTFVAPRLSNPKWTAKELAAVVRAHNRGMAAFCAGDSRLVGVGAVGFHDADHALREARWALGRGLRALQVPSDAFWGIGPSHASLERFWRYCATEGVLVTTHIGGGVLLPDVYHARGRPDEPGEAPAHLRPKDFAVVHHTVQRFLTCMALDGVLERHPGLRLGIMEQGGGWLPGFMRHLDHAAERFAKDRDIRRLKRPPSETLRRQVKVTPFFFEDVGALTRELGDDGMLLFSTDYPHFEGGRDPEGDFRRHFARHRMLRACGERFFGGNLRALLRASP